MARLKWRTPVTDTAPASGVPAPGARASSHPAMLAEMNERNRKFWAGMGDPKPLTYDADQERSDRATLADQSLPMAVRLAAFARLQQRSQRDK